LEGRLGPGWGVAVDAGGEVNGEGLKEGIPAVAVFDVAMQLRGRVQEHGEVPAVLELVEEILHFVTEAAAG
jgi:hypothetical protein